MIFEILSDRLHCQCKYFDLVQESKLILSKDPIFGVLIKIGTKN